MQAPIRRNSGIGACGNWRIVRRTGKKLSAQQTAIHQILHLDGGNHAVRDIKGDVLAIRQTAGLIDIAGIIGVRLKARQLYCVRVYLFQMGEAVSAVKAPGVQSVPPDWS